MRKPTEEQKAKAAERRSRMRTLAANIGKMSESERAALAARLPGVVTIEGRALSMHNQLMLASQLSNATIVGGFRQWKKAGRSVRKGEHGASIWIPLGDKVKHEDGTSETMNVEHFGLASVFDISQTEDLATAEARRKESAPAVTFDKSDGEINWNYLNKIEKREASGGGEDYHCSDMGYEDQCAAACGSN